MKVHDNIRASNGTSHHGYHIIATAQSLIDLFGEPTFDGASCDGGQMEWVLDHNGNCITVYDRCVKAYRLTDDVRWHIGAHNSYDAMTASAELNQLIQNHNAK